MRQSPPLCLGINRAIRKFFSFGQQVIIFGWDLVGQQLDHNEVLMSTGKVIISRNSECKAVFKSENSKFKSPKEIICTVANTTKACRGDYGSAVIAQHGRYRLILGGVVSKRTKMCGTTKSYLAHSKTYSKRFINWIKTIM